MNLKLYFLRIWIFTFVLIASACKNNQQNFKIDFDLNGQSYLYLKNKTNDSLNIKISNWYLLPVEEQKFDTLIKPNSTIKFTLITKGKSYYDLKLGKQEYKIFTTPNAIDSLTVLVEQKVIFSGDHNEINEFTLSKTKVFNSINSDWLPRVNSTHKSDNVQNIIDFNDSITQVHLTFLDKNSSKLPYWYINYESKRLKYLNAGWKLNTFLYRNRLLNKNDSLRPDFLENAVKQINLQDESMVADKRYSYFINDYINFRIDPYLKSKIPNSNKELSLYYSNLIDVTDKELFGLTRDFHISTIICKVNDHQKHLLEEKWLELIKDNNLKSFVQKHLEASPLLPTGSAIPYFYLPDEHGNYHEPAHFKDNILYINFWATWCKPCIKEFPHENSLVNRFKDEPVTIINICLESDTAKWKEIIYQHNLKTLNLIAIGNWSDKLKRDFDIKGIPHSVLIAPNGKIIQNKSPRASQIEEEILKLLDKTKKPAL